MYTTTAAGRSPSVTASRGCRTLPERRLAVADNEVKPLCVSDFAKSPEQGFVQLQLRDEDLVRKRAVHDLSATGETATVEPLVLTEQPEGLVDVTHHALQFRDGGQPSALIV